MISPLAERIFQVVIFTGAAFMALGGGFFHEARLESNATRTVTYTLYKSLPPPPQGPYFCKAVTVGDYGLMLPCDYKPPFVWWLQRKLR
jgi:hypothetical protein